ncbi:MAG: M23 family metallopeptidase [Spirochaetaceae bacterium]|jgi:murein DD-endopeptidase MepM/ murein hydrolase activator NlpD|nr:M23 family metallopeptidase [Spirochaetaceae bacterium]
MKHLLTIPHTIPYIPLICTILLVLLPMGLAAPEEAVHIIQKGETIYSIARSYGVTAEELIKLNNINDPRTIQAGQRIRIPSKGPVILAYDEYKVERNDTLYGIAKKYNITVAELLEMNGFAPGYVLKAGEKIRVPTANSSVAASGDSTVPVPPPPNPAAEKPVPAVEKPVPAATWPVKAKAVSYLTGGLYGVQVTGEKGEPVKSLTQGTVVSTGPFRGFGNVAIVQKSGGYLYVYGGCETLLVKEGDKVVPGTELGKLGVDAKTAKPQLFFLVYQGNTPIDPVKAPRA